MLLVEDEEGILGLVANAFNVAPGLLDDCVATADIEFNVVMVGVD